MKNRLKIFSWIMLVAFSFTFLLPIASAVASSLSLSLEKLKVGYLNPVNVNAYGDGTTFDSNIQLELDDVLSSAYVANEAYQNPGLVNFNIMPGLGVGQHKVTISGPTQTAVDAYFEVVTPSFTLSTDLVQAGYSAPVDVVANAVYTTFVNGNTTAKLFLGESEVTGGLTGSSVTDSTYNFTIATGLAAGAYTVKITTTGTETGTEVLTQPFTIYAASISTLSPDNVHVGYTSPKTINVTGSGTGFSASTIVYVKNNSTLVETQASGVTVPDATHLSFTLPSDLAAGAYTVRVVTGSEQVTKAFTVRNPSISSISPASIPDSWVAGSNVPVTVYGTQTKFSLGSTVSLSKGSFSLNLSNTVDSDIQLRATIPAGSVVDDTYTLKVEVAGGETITSPFTVYHPSMSINPNQKPSNYSNFTMTVTGTNTHFDGTTTLSVVYQGAEQPNKVSSLSVSGPESLTFTLASGLSYTGIYSIKAITGNETAEAPFTITPTQSSDANLTSLLLSNGTLNPVFSGSTTNYTANVVYGVSSITFTPTLSNPGASVTVNGVSVTSGQASGPISLNVLDNIIPVVVTAEDSSTKTYSVTIHRGEASVDNNLSSLSVNQGTLTPSFASGTTSYTVDVGNNITNISVTPTVADATATVKVNGSNAVSGAAYGPINLNVGANPIPVVVTAENGTTNTYTITVNRAQSSNNNLSNLVVGAGTLTPAFAPATTSYSVTVPYTTTQFSLTPTKADTTATITVNGTAAVSDAVYGPYGINVGANTFTIVVTAEDSTTKTYTVTVNRTAPSSNNNLAGIALSAGTLTPAFAQGTNSYTVDVANIVTNFSITPTVADTFATITVNGTAAVSGAVYGPYGINVGANTFTIVVTSQDGTPKTYTIIVNRAQSANNNLSSLAVSTGSLTPAFAASTISYTVNVANSITNFSITPTLADITASMTVNGTAAVSGNVYGPYNINVGANPFTIVVTAQNGAQKTYTVTVTKAASSNNNLSNLSLSSGTLSPVFASGTTNYTAGVVYGTSSITVTPTIADVTATVTVNGIAVTSGQASSPINLSVGTNTITVVVTAQDGSTKTYTIAVTRQDAFTVNTTFNASSLAANQLLDASATITSNQSDAQNVLLIVALYDASNAMVNVSYISKNVAGGTTENLHAGFKLPSSITGYKVKAFVWDGIDLASSSMIPVSNVTTLE